MHSVICILTAQHDQVGSKLKFTSMGAQHTPWWQVYLKVQSTQPHYKKQCHMVYHFHIPLQTHYQNYKPSSKC